MPRCCGTDPEKRREASASGPAVMLVVSHMPLSPHRDYNGRSQSSTQRAGETLRARHAPAPRRTAMNNQTFFHQTMSQEFERFHNVLAALPGENLAFKHEPRSRSARELVGHIIGHVDDMIELIDAGVIHHRMEVPFANHEAAVKAFDTSYQTLLTKLE